MRVLECEHAHESHHQARGRGQRHRGQDHHGSQQQRRQIDDVVTVYAVDGQHTLEFLQQAQSFQAQAEQTGDYPEHPLCPHSQGRHWGIYRKIAHACFTCGELGHLRATGSVAATISAVAPATSAERFGYTATVAAPTCTSSPALGATVQGPAAVGVAWTVWSTGPWWTAQKGRLGSNRCSTCRGMILSRQMIRWVTRCRL